MSSALDEINRRRTFAIISHPDAGNTTLTERLDPEVLSEIRNEYLGDMTDIVFAHDGMLDKYIGDAVMAVWGAPLP